MVVGVVGVLHFGRNKNVVIRWEDRGTTIVTLEATKISPFTGILLHFVILLKKEICNQLLKMNSKIL